MKSGATEGDDSKGETASDAGDRTVGAAVGAFAKDGAILLTEAAKSFSISSEKERWTTSRAKALAPAQPGLATLLKMFAGAVTGTNTTGPAEPPLVDRGETRRLVAAEAPWAGSGRTTVPVKLFWSRASRGCSVPMLSPSKRFVKTEKPTALNLALAVLTLLSKEANEGLNMIPSVA
jgi:hypothetical protein